VDDPFVGRIIAERYRIVEPIGAGGMADVYRGEHIHMRKRVAIKVLNPSTERLPELVSRFEREAIAGAQVHHPNVAIATDFGKMDDGSFYLVLEYIRGKTLRDELDELGKLPPARAALIAMQVAAALGASHDAGVVHRDLKPANVMLVEGEKDFVKLIDFGFAKVDEARLSTSPGDAPFGRPLTGIGQMFGTPPYMAPESIGGMDAVDSRSDLYSLGVVLYEMLGGRRPFEIEDRVELFGKKANEDAPALSSFVEGVPEELEAITMRLLEREPGSRFATAHEVEEALRPITHVPVPSLLPMPTPLPAPVAEPSMPPPAPRRNLGPVVFGAIGVLVLVIAGGAVLRKVGGPAPTTAPSTLASPSSAASPEASAAPSGEPAAASPRAELWKAVAKRDPKRGAQAVISLADAEPAAFREPDVIAAAANLAATMDALDASVANTMFDLFTQKLGAEGVDVLFEIVRTRGAEKGPGKRAMDLLRDDKIVARASPALRVLLELRAAPCPKKRELFERAAADGDARMLLELRSLRSSPCTKKAGPCCFKTDKPLYDAINTLKTRVGGPLHA
jgi:serine/threonine-protein kinase